MRQHLVDDTPVVETAMHVPGGDVVHRAYAVRDRGPTGDDADLLVVEIENRSAVPVALALVVGPFDPYAPAPGADPAGEPSGGSVSSLTLDVGPERSVLMVNGRPGLLLAKPPARVTSVRGRRGPAGGGDRRPGAAAARSGRVSRRRGPGRPDLPAAPHRHAAGGAAPRFARGGVGRIPSWPLPSVSVPIRSRRR